MGGLMYGAIIGDIMGSPYEFAGNREYWFPLLYNRMRFTDDTVMTLAVADALMDSSDRDMLIAKMKDIGRRYPDSGYGNRFAVWLFSDDNKPYNSYGNGSAMRVSSVGWLFDTIDDTRRTARMTAEVTHNHEEGIKGAEAVASAIFFARTGRTKHFIRTYIEDNFGYDLHRSADEIRMDYKFDATCQGSVPEAITCFLESRNFEDALRTAISLGGDADTQGAITGSIAEAYYGVSDRMKEEFREYLPKEFTDILDKFEIYRKKPKRQKMKWIF